MSQLRINKLAVALGLLLAGNGVLLATSPGRFVTLRRMGWLPERYNATLDHLAIDQQTGRQLGATATMAGIALIAAGLRRTEPAA